MNAEITQYMKELEAVTQDPSILTVDQINSEINVVYKVVGMTSTTDTSNMTTAEKKELEDMGVNDSMIHVDFMIGTSDMKIVGITSDDQEVVIFENGNWAF